MSAPWDFDPYAVLGLDRSATKEEVQKAYRRLAAKWYPDRNPDNRQAAEAQFRLVGQANAVLSDPDKRAYFERYGLRGLDAFGPSVPKPVSTASTSKAPRQQFSRADLEAEMAKQKAAERSSSASSSFSGSAGTSGGGGGPGHAGYQYQQYNGGDFGGYAGSSGWQQFQQPHGHHHGLYDGSYVDEFGQPIDDDRRYAGSRSKPHGQPPPFSAPDPPKKSQPAPAPAPVEDFFCRFFGFGSSSDSSGSNHTVGGFSKPAATSNNYHDELPRLASTSPTECCACNCEKPFNDNERVPRVLAECGHTVCDPCLRQLAEPTSDGKLEAKCPSCTTTTKLGGVDSFPTNHILLGHIRSVQPKPSTKPKCEGCAKPAEFGCADCKVKLCSDCWPKAHVFGAQLSHVKGSLSDAEQPLQCSRHPKKETDYMCVDASCPAKDELICYLCKDTPPHKGHQTEVLDQCLIDRVFDDKRHELNADIDRMHDSIAFAARLLAHVNSTQQATTTNRDTAIHHIEEHFEQLIEQLRARKAELIGQVNELVGFKSENLEAQRREVTGYLEQSYSAVHAGIDGMKVTNQRQFLSSYRSLHDRLAQLSNTKLFGKAVSSLVNVSLGDELGDSIRKHGAVTDDGDVAQAPMLPSSRAELIPHFPTPGELTHSFDSAARRPACPPGRQASRPRTVRP